MKTLYSESTPNIIKDLNGKVTEIHHNHYRNINYLSYQNSSADKNKLDQLIDQQTVFLTGCTAFFKTVAEHKDTDVALSAVAKYALEEDKARLKDFEQHRRRSSCTIL